MSNSTEECPKTKTRISPLSRDYFHGNRQPLTGEKRNPDADDNLEERASLSSVLIARAVNRVVTPHDSALGYIFKRKPPNKVKTVGGLGAWIQAECHEALDDLVDTDPQIALLANRYEVLIMTQQGLNQKSKKTTRRSALMFQQGVSEPVCWLRTAALAASYNGHRLVRSQAQPFLIDKLKVMQLTARKDMARQDVRSAINQATNALGSMLTPEHEEAALRYQILSSFVLARTGHALHGRTFGDLYDVSIDPNNRVRLEEREAGFGPIKPKRDAPVACPASYRFAPSLEAIVDRSALSKLLGASISAMGQRDLYGEPLTTRLRAVSIAKTELDKGLLE